MYFNVKAINIFIQYFFLLCVLYWFPYVSNDLLANIKVLGLMILSVSIFVFSLSEKISIKGFILILCFVFCVLCFEAYNQGDGSYLKFTFTVLIFYILGCFLAKSRFSKLGNLPFYIFIIICLWIILSKFVPQLDFKNSLKLDYTFEEIKLSSTAFSIARTSWGLSIFLLSMFYYYLEHNEFKKKILIILPFLTVLFISARGGMLYFFTAIVVFILFSRFGFYKKIVFISLLFISSVFVFLNFGSDLRLSDVDDISNGRFEQYQYFSLIFSQNYSSGTYSTGTYDLRDYGLYVSNIHNSFLNLLAKYGLVGSAPILILLITSLYKIYKSFYRGYTSLYLIIIGGLTACFLEPDSIFSYGYHVLIFWFCLGFLSAKRRLQLE